MPIATKLIQDFINATKTQLATITSQIAALTAWRTKTDAVITAMQQRIAQFPVQQPAPVPVTPPSVGEDLATLPQLTVDTTYSLPTGTTFTPANSAAFTTAIASAALNDVIVLTAGVTYNGPFNLPNKTTGSGWIYIISSALASLPASGTRVGMADVSNMPTIACATGSGRCITTSAIAHHFRFVGINFQPQAGASPTQLVSIGANETSSANLPHHIIFDRCLIQGDPTVNSRRGIAMNGNYIAVIESYVHNFKDDGADSQALWAYNCTGPTLIHNNFLEAAGENVMFGGADPNIAGAVPSDITITRNYFFKRLSWISASWIVKNILEFKNAQRILVQGNVFENVWVAAQTGYLLNAKSVNQDGGGTSCIVKDLTFRKNRGKNLENGLTLGGDLSEVVPALAPTRWLIEHNELQVANVNGGDGYGIFHGQGGYSHLLTHVTIRHNTIVGIRFDQHHLDWAAVDGVVNTDVAIMDNIYEGPATNGFKGRTSAEGTATLDARLTNGTVRYNAWQGRSSGSYTAASGSGNTMSNNFFPATQAAIDFVNYAGANYRLNASSPLHNAASDGTDVGANIDAIDAAIAG